MIINQKTTLIFEYPQDYLQEQEWCKTKEDRWIHKGTDTLGAVYENQISYSIGASVSVKTEPTSSKMEQVDKDINVRSKPEPQSCDTCKFADKEWYEEPCDRCGYMGNYEPKDEPQTNADQHVQHVESVETMSCEECKHWIFTSQWGWFCPLKGQDECHYEPIEDEPQTNGYQTFNGTSVYVSRIEDEPQTDCAWGQTE